MKNFFIAAAALLVIGGGAYLLSKKGNDEAMPLGTPSGNSSQNTPTPSSASTTYKDGTYKGDSIATERGYGNVQVAAVISAGKITDIQFLQMPDLPGHTQEVSSLAEPILKQEAITVQNAQVDSVSGATQTTAAFQQSLASALNQAH